MQQHTYMCGMLQGANPLIAVRFRLAVHDAFLVFPVERIYIEREFDKDNEIILEGQTESFNFVFTHT
jgi:hypothetical protein